MPLARDADGYPIRINQLRESLKILICMKIIISQDSILVHVIVHIGLAGEYPWPPITARTATYNVQALASGGKMFISRHPTQSGK
jgi:hypothetical protein